MIVTELNPAIVPGAKIKVLGIGGGGNKAINRMVNEGLDGVEFVAINTDAQDLGVSLADRKLNIGLNLTKGLGAGANPEIGRKAAEESEAEVKEMLKDSDMVFITGGMGGGTFTGAGPVIANIAKEMGILTVAIITKPFGFEGLQRMNNAMEGINKLKPTVDTLIIIPNDKIFNIIDKKTTFKQAFIMIDRVLFLGVQGISDLIVHPGDINVDFADVKKVMQNGGNALLGIGYGAGEKRAIDAARKAIENPLLETNLDKAKSAIFAVTGGEDLTPMEVQEAMNEIESILDDETEIIWGMTFDPSMEDEVKVTLIATGFEEQQRTEEIISKPRRDILGRPTDEKPKEAQNFITRGLELGKKKNEEKSDTAEIEDLETPAFIRKKLK